MSSRSEAFSTLTAAGSPPRRDPSLIFLGTGVLALAAALLYMLFVGQASDTTRPFLGYLVGASFWLMILIGMLFLNMIWWLFDAGWPIILRRQIEHALAGIPVLALVFLPLILIALFGNEELVPWLWLRLDSAAPGGHGTVGEDVLYVAKSPYLNAGFFALRYVLIFGVLSGLALAFRRWSFRMDETGDHGNVHAARRLAALGVFAAAIVSSMGAIDWFKSLNYHWFSTMYGVWFFAASMRAGLAGLVLIMFYMAGRNDGLRGIIKPAHFYYMGCIMLAFTVFWAYISFSQFFLIYSANIPEETFWYNIRELAVYTTGINPEGVATYGMKSNWWWISRGLIYLYFFFPFLWLLFYKNKFGPRLMFIAVWILAFHLIDLYWNVIPQKLPTDAPGLDYDVRQFSVGLSDVLAFVGTGCLVIWAFLRSAATHRPIPIRDPRILESVNAHE